MGKYTERRVVRWDDIVEWARCEPEEYRAWVAKITTFRSADRSYPHPSPTTLAECRSDDDRKRFWDAYANARGG